MKVAFHLGHSASVRSIWVCWLIMLNCRLAVAQESPRPLPVPLIYGGASLQGGGGYAPVAGLVGLRCELPLRRLTLAVQASYESVRKTNDNTGLNPNGRERQIGAEIRIHLPHYWFAGPVVDWEELDTTNYRKSSWHPGFGVGREFSWMRLSGDFMLAGSDRSNGAEGLALSLFFPSPVREHSRFFYREQIEIYRFHDTVTNWQDTALTQAQLADHAWASTVEMTFGVRF